MLNRIVFTEKEQILTLKVIDELRHEGLHLAKQSIQKRLASSNSRKVTLDLNNLQVMSLDTRELLGLIIKIIRLKKIPIYISGSSEIDPAVLLEISEGKPNLIPKNGKKKQIVKTKPKYFKQFSVSFFSNNRNKNVHQTLNTENNLTNPTEIKEFIGNGDYRTEEISLDEYISEKYYGWLKWSWVLFLGLTGMIFTLFVLPWPEYFSEKNRETLMNDERIKSLEKHKAPIKKIQQKKSDNYFLESLKKEESTIIKHHLASTNYQGSNYNIGYTPLMIAVKEQKKELVKLLVENGAYLDVKDKSGDTPLVLASSIKNLDLVKLLLQNNANPDLGNFPPIMWAVIHGDISMLKLFLQAGANLNVQTTDGMTALMWAAKKGDTHATWELLKHGARVNIQNIRGKTALILASRRGYLGTIRLLLNNGGDPLVVDFEGKNAADYASELLQEEALMLLKNELLR